MTGLLLEGSNGAAPCPEAEQGWEMMHRLPVTKANGVREKKS